MKDYLEKLGVRAKKAKYILAKMKTEEKNAALNAAAAALEKEAEAIIEANRLDLENADRIGMKASLKDRLMLDGSRISAMADGIREVAALDDPVGEVTGMKKRPNGLMIGQKRVPIGVIGIIYEARPNVTSDAFALCFKAGNVCILKGGSDAINSNKAIAQVIRKSLEEHNACPDALQLVESTDRSDTCELMKMNEYIDVMIPRGSAGLIRSVVENSTVPVIETGSGNCHIYVDKTADFNMALDIIENAKTQRTGVCNACESLVVHKGIADSFLPLLYKRLSAKHVEMRGDEYSKRVVPSFTEADEADYGTEYLDYIISIRTVNDIDEAIEHINKYNTGHSESIITSDYANAQKFLDEIDAAAVYVNASTRFTDGHEFGFGAEIGISTQKLHARGPMGLKELTCLKYIIYGNGQIRS